MNYELCPCTYCSKVPDPRNCDNKKCVPWRKWFVNRWDQTRKLFCRSMANAPVEQVGVPLGGERYAHPHRVRAYRQNGPCPSCSLPKDLCAAPCPAYRMWKEETEETYGLEN